MVGRWGVSSFCTVTLDSALRRHPRLTLRRSSPVFWLRSSRVSLFPAGPKLVRHRWVVVMSARSSLAGPAQVTHPTLVQRRYEDRQANPPPLPLDNYSLPYDSVPPKKAPCSSPTSKRTKTSPHITHRVPFGSPAREIRIGCIPLVCLHAMVCWTTRSVSQPPGNWFCAGPYIASLV